MPTITANTSAQVTLPAGQYINGTGAGVALVGTGGAGADPLSAGDAWQIGPFLTSQTVHLTAYTLLDYEIRSPLAAPPAGLTTAQTTATQALVSEDVIVARTRTWATLGAPADYIGLAYVTDVGLRGSLWRSDGSAWGLVGGSCVLAITNVAGTALTGTTTETPAFTYSAPAGLLGLNGALHIQGKATLTNSANNKTLRVRLGAVGSGITGSILQDAVLTTTASAPFGCRIENRNSLSSQIGGNDTLQDTIGVNAWRTATVNTGAAFDVNLTAQLANTGESITLQSARIILYRP